MKVNIEALKQLQISQELVNYKQLCNKIDIEYSAGYKKKKQLEDLKSFCHYERNGTKFKITEVITNKSNIFIPHKNNKYGQEIYDIIFYLLKGKKRIYISKNKLLTSAGMINNEFSKFKNMDKNKDEYEEYIKKMNIDNTSNFKLEEVLQVIYNILTSKMDKYLEDLSIKGYFNIEYSFQYQIELRNNSIKIENIELNSDLYKKIKKYAEEIGFFRENIPLHLKNEQYKTLCLWLKTETSNFNIKHVWKCYVLTINDNLPEILEERYKQCIKKINKITVELLKKSQQIKLEKEQKQIIIDDLIKINKIPLFKDIDSTQTQYLCPVMNCYCDKLEHYCNCK